MILCNTTTQQTTSNSIAMMGDSHTTLSLWEDDESVCSVDSENSEETNEAMDLLENFLQNNIRTKSYSQGSDGKGFTFEHDCLRICINLRSKDRKIDISCTVHKVAHSSNGKGISYSLMTKMMKYKAIFQRSTKRQQVGIYDGKFLYIRTLSISILQKEFFLELSREIEGFISMAEQMQTDFDKEKEKRKTTKNIESRPMHRWSSC